MDILETGTQSMDEIKEMVLRTMSYGREAALATVAGRSKFDAIMWGIMSSLCNAGLAEGTTVRRFRITEKGIDVHGRHKPLLTGEILEKESMDYRRLSAYKGPLVPAPTPKNAPLASKSGIVALIDMLGTRGPHEARGAARMHGNWNALLSRAKGLAWREKELQGCNVSAFSDTMIITAEGDAEALLGAFGRACTLLIPASICLDIPIRGCVAAGKFFQSSGKLITGPAITEAAAYYELPQWIGISCCPSAHSRIDGMAGGRACYTGYDIPLKSSVEYNGLAVNWPDYYNREHAGREKELDCMLRRLECRLKIPSDISASLKWRNTRDFLCAGTGVEGRPVGRPRMARRRQAGGSGAKEPAAARRSRP